MQSSPAGNPSWLFPKGDILLIPEEEYGWHAWGPPLAMVAATSIAILALSLMPPRHGPVALVFPPWWNNAQVAAGAARAGRLIRLGGLRFIMVVQPDGGGASPDRSGGAWMILSPRLFGACSPVAVRP